MNKQVLLEGLQRALRDNDVRWPIGAKEEKLGRSTTSRCRGNEIKSGRINPMEILENQNQRAFCRQSLQSVTNLTYHALARGSQDLLLQSLSLLRFDQRGELAQPGGSTLLFLRSPRRIVPEQFSNLVGRRPADEKRRRESFFRCLPLR